MPIADSAAAHLIARAVPPEWIVSVPVTFGLNAFSIIRLFSPVLCRIKPLIVITRGFIFEFKYRLPSASYGSASAASLVCIHINPRLVKLKFWE